MNTLAKGLCLLLVGCGDLPDEVSLRGTALDGPDAGAGPLRSADVLVRDQRGRPYASSTTDDQGRFRTRAPVGVPLFVELSGDGIVPTSFLGVTGTVEVQRIEDGVVYGLDTAVFDAWREDFAGCPGADAPTGTVLGEVRFTNLSDPDTREHPLAITATVVVQAPDGTEYPACYLDDEGTGFAPDAVVTGHTGRFAVFDVPPGVYDLVIGYTMIEGQGVQFEVYPVHVPERGVAPRFPARLEWAM